MSKDEKVSVHPNPSGESCDITFNLPEEEKLSIELLDLNGKLLKKLVDKKAYATGVYTVRLSNQELSNGIYLLRFSGVHYTGIRKLSVIK